MFHQHISFIAVNAVTRGVMIYGNGRYILLQCKNNQVLSRRTHVIQKVFRSILELDRSK